jgi:DNA-directed RNA polymerase subunit E'/Rpb7
MGYKHAVLRLKNIGISPDLLGNNIDDEIFKKSTTLLKGTQTRHGIVLSIKNLKIDGEGEINFDNTGFTRYNVLAKVFLFLPETGEILVTKVKDVPSNGFYVDTPIDIFVHSSSYSNSRVEKVCKKVGDEVSIKITKVSFNRGKFMILAKEQ